MVRFNSFLILSPFLIILTLSPVSRAQRVQIPLPIEDALAAPYFSLGTSPATMMLSPDGQDIAYTLCSATKKEPSTNERYLYFTGTGVPRSAIGCDIWLTSTKSGNSRNLTKEKGSNWAPVWSPNGKYLAFYSDRDDDARLWVWEKASGLLREISNEVVYPYEATEVARWTPDSRAVLSKVLPEGMTIERAATSLVGNPRESGIQKNKTQSTVVIYDSSQTLKQNKLIRQQVSDAQLSVYERRTLADLALIDVASRRLERIAHGVYTAGYWISPTGDHVAYTTVRGYDEALSASPSEQILYDLVVTSIVRKANHVVAQRVPMRTYGNAVSWSPDGRMLSYVTGGRLAKGDCFVVGVEGGVPRNLTQSPHPSFSGQPPLWDAVGGSVYLLGANALWKVSVTAGPVAMVAQIPERQITGIVIPSRMSHSWVLHRGESIVFSTRDDETKKAGFYKVDPTTGKYIKLLEDDKFFSNVDSNVDPSTNHQIMTYVAEDAETPPSIWLVDIDFGDSRRLTSNNANIGGYVMGRSQLVAWTTADGQKLKGALLLPSNYERGKRYPLIVVPYAGALLSNSLNRFGLYPGNSGVDNMQVLATRGYAVLLPDAPLRDGMRMQDLAKEILPGIDKVVDMGIADQDRLGLMGHSHGGYASLALMVQSTRFKAAISRSPRIPDLTGVYGMMLKDGTSPFVTWAETSVGMLGGTLWDARDKYIENSPLFYLDRVQTPLLLTYGSLDYGAFQADAVFVGLRRLGKEVVYAKYEGEFHWEGGWGYSNQLDYWHRAISWFSDHLRVSKRRDGASSSHQ